MKFIHKVTYLLRDVVSWLKKPVKTLRSSFGILSRTLAGERTFSAHISSVNLFAIYLLSTSSFNSGFLYSTFMFHILLELNNIFYLNTSNNNNTVNRDYTYDRNQISVFTEKCNILVLIDVPILKTFSMLVIWGLVLASLRSNFAYM